MFNYNMNKGLATFVQLILLFLTLPSLSYALDVGGMTLYSALNQKLDARIALFSLKPKEVPNIAVSMASETTYMNKGINRSPLLKDVRLAIKTPLGRAPFIHITSDRVVTEPTINFLISVRWNNKQLLREFLPLFDPPSTLTYYKVLKNETVWQIAEKMRPEGISVEQMMLALQRENPTAFFGDNVSFLNAGAVLRVRDTSVLNAITPDKATMKIARQYDSWVAYQRKTNHGSGQIAKIHESDNNPPSNETTNLPSRFATLEDKVLMIERLIELREGAIAVIEKPENKDVLNRLASLEEQMSAMKDLIRLRNAVLREPASFDPVFEKVLLNSVQKNSAEIYQYWWQTYTNSFRDPKSVAGIIFIASLLILLVWFFLSRPQIMDRRVTYGVHKQQPLSEPLQEDEIDTVAKIDLEVISFNKTMTENVELKQNIGSFEDAGSDYIKIMDSSEVTLDPTAEADVYLIYEKYEKAEYFLRKAIEEDPQRQELKLKLLEVFALSRNVLKFDKQAEELFSAIGGKEENTLWQHALLMAKDVDTHSPLFQTKQNTADASPPLKNKDQKDVELSRED